ncbi:hypothetical protein PR202_ga06047 [Eleusine coracana subsp. coracana]|uniref:Protein CHUP1, chloroplastic n=1 Tax=Eleusine coracana subsp. coracana TaxID=191504 RepID=A0AAV5BUF0_ELECO|nr:hypothetical protein PR202_ga06047 [Eleusine coracana subsp. coracana]
MLMKLGFVVVASVAAFTFKNVNGGAQRSKDNGQARKRKDKTHHSEHLLQEEKEEEEEKEEVKTINGVINSARSINEDDDDMLSDLESLLSGDIDIPLPSDRFDVKGRSHYNAHMVNAAEVERLRNRVREMEEREAKLEGELLEYYGMKEMETDVAELQKQQLKEERKKLQDDIAHGAVIEKELEAARKKIKELQRQVQLEAGQTKGQLMLLKQQVTGLKAKEEEAAKKDAEVERKLKKLKELQVESDVVSHAQEEINKLRQTNEDLTKQVEGLQMNRFSEVEELVYLRWVNACLRFELRNYQTPSGKVSARDLNRTLSPKSQEMAKHLMLEYAGSERGHDTDLESASSIPSSPGSEDFDNISIDSSSSRYSFLGKKTNLMQKLKKSAHKLATEREKGNKREGRASKSTKNNPLVVSQLKLANIEKRAPRVPRPPPVPSATASGVTNATSAALPPRPPGVPPPPPPPGKPGGPPPPPPPPGALSRSRAGGDKVHRAPEIVEFYQSLMKREAKKETSLRSTSTSVSDARSNIIGEIENRSTFLLAVKADVETQGEFVESLANEVRAASFVNIGDVVAFVNWLDEELSFLVDERAVLKHFDWPESKTDALREAEALKKMYSLLEKVEQSVYALLRTRDMAVSRYKEYGIPVDWLSDSGVVGKIKLASVQLANKYMKRVASELDAMEGTEKEPNREFLLLQGVRFAFRVHQFAGGFDAESMKAFEELRSKMTTQTSAPQMSEA